MVKLFRTPYFLRWIYRRRVWGFSSSKSIFLTFDDGPTTELTEWIVDLLDQKGVKATFFCVGANVRKHPQLIELMKSKGHVLGNHTMQHDKGHKVDRKEYFDSIEETNALLNSDLFRPPYGRLPMNYDKELAEKYKIIMWSWLSYDYDHTVSVETILERADAQIKPGDILVLHDNVKVKERLKLVLPKLIDLLKEKGYEFSTISS